VSRNPQPTGYAETLVIDCPTSAQLLALPGVTVDISALFTGI
jgi:hypothetical protein